MKLLYGKKIVYFWYTSTDTDHIIIANRPSGEKGWGRRGARGRGGAREKVKGGCFDLAANVSWMSLVFNMPTLS